MKAINQEVHCERMDVILSLIYPAFSSNQIAFDLWLISFMPMPWHNLQS